MPIAAAVPWILSAVGSILPSVISSLTGAKTPEEAKAAIAPHRAAIIAQAIGRGMRRDEAEMQADEQLSGALQEEMQKGAIPGWAELGLGLVGGGAGALAGKAIKGASKLAGKAVAKEATATAKGDPLAALSKRPGEPVPKAPKTMEMEPRRTPGPMDRAMDDGSEALMQDAPQTGLTAPFRKFDADIGAPSSGRAARPMRDAEFEVVTPAKRLSYRGEEVGAMPPSIPKSERELFREEIAAATRANMDTAPPKVLRRPSFRLPYNEADDVAAQMRKNSDSPDILAGIAGDDADDLAAWAARSEDELRGADLAQLRKRMRRY